MPERPPRPPAPEPHAGHPEPAPIESTSLFGAFREVAIRHNGRIYRLRRTRLGKLILTA